MIAAAAALALASAIEAPGPLAPLHGTLLSPPDPKATILIIPGSGPTDRDGDNPLGVKAAPYRLLAEALAARGIASVRIDKRGMYASRGATENVDRVTIADYAADVHSWVSAIRAKTGAQCVWLAGHSEGGLVALAAAQQADNICGVVLIAAAGRPLGEVVRAQLTANPANAPLLDQAIPAIDALEAGEHVDTAGMDPRLLPLFRAEIQDFLIDAFAKDPAKLIADIGLPVLIAQGDEDLQVSVADAELLQAAAPKATLKIVPGMNHVLKIVPKGDMRANAASYADPSLPVAPGLVDAIAGVVAR